MPEHNEPLEEGVDQLTQWRERCADHVADFKAVLDECNDRVNSRSNTDEVCHQVSYFSEVVEVKTCKKKENLPNK
ncbi:hypothetical protein Y032_0538g3138 [Ancylostoma ceylanicum]|uniref:Ubiquinol-cytochrome C reductase hinge domain-containing protein n=1 Tax=Ancylostoma ceylanicum TaxID=53326 RepID=A0A016WRF6_9BILA|nr:hypothetical protein Y032_0538g3138 [Ancylostoma ceylanicum]